MKIQRNLFQKCVRVCLCMVRGRMSVGMGIRVCLCDCYKLPFASSNMTISKLSFQRITLPTGIKPFRLQNVQICFLFTRAQLSGIMRRSGSSSWWRDWHNYRKFHKYVVLVRCCFLCRIDRRKWIEIVRFTIVREYQIV